MPSPRIVAVAAFAAATLTAVPAGADTTSSAIAACRTAVAQELSVEPGELRVDRIQTRGRVVKVRLEVKSGGVADCKYATRDASTQVAVIEPATTGQAGTATAPTGR
jgi:hypothetical protein